MSQDGARKSQQAQPADGNDSFLEDAFNERTIIRPNPYLANGPAPSAETPSRTAPAEVMPKSSPSAPATARASSAPAQPALPKKFAVEPPRPKLSAIDEAFDERTTVLSQSKPTPMVKSTPLPANVEMPAPVAVPPAPRAAPAPVTFDSDSGTATNGSLELNISQPVPAMNRAPSMRSPMPEIVPNEDWELRSEKTQTSWPVLSRIASVPRQHLIGVGVILVAIAAFFFLKDRAPEMAASPAPSAAPAPSAPVVAEAKTEKEKPRAETREPAQTPAPNAEAVLLLFDMAYARTQGQVHADAGNP